MISFAIVVAVDERFGIGKQGQLPWYIPGDLKRFKEITTQTEDTSKQNAVIMGRKTWESLPVRFRPLPDRINLVLSRRTDLLLPRGVTLAESFNDALEKLAQTGLSAKIESVFVIGGFEVFKQAIEHPGCRRIYLTRICAEFACDTFFPLIPKVFHQVSVQPVSTENSPRYSFEIFEK